MHIDRCIDVLNGCVHTSILRILWWFIKNVTDLTKGID